MENARGWTGGATGRNSCPYKFVLVVHQRARRKKDAGSAPRHTHRSLTTDEATTLVPSGDEMHAGGGRRKRLARISPRTNGARGAHAPPAVAQPLHALATRSSVCRACRCCILTQGVRGVQWRRAKEIAMTRANSPATQCPQCSRRTSGTWPAHGEVHWRSAGRRAATLRAGSGVAGLRL